MKKFTPYQQTLKLTTQYFVPGVNITGRQILRIPILVYIVKCQYTVKCSAMRYLKNNENNTNGQNINTPHRSTHNYRATNNNYTETWLTTIVLEFSFATE